MSEEKGLTREDLKYMFDAASEKFFKEFKAVKTEPIITINSSSAPVSVEEINRELARMLREANSNIAKDANPPKTIKNLKITLLGHELKFVSKISFEGIRAKLEFWWGGENNREGSFSVDVPFNWVTLDFKE